MSAVKSMETIVREFYEGTQPSLILHNLTREERMEVHELAHTTYHRKLVSRSEYEATTILLQCDGCGHFNNRDNSKWDSDGLGGDYYYYCSECFEYNGYCNEYEDMAEMKKVGTLKCTDYKPTRNLLLLRMPINCEYKNRSFNKSYRKHYNRKQIHHS